MLEFIKLFKSLRPSYENLHDMKALAKKLENGKETGV